jgi:hypothetical protein
MQTTSQQNDRVHRLGKVSSRRGPNFDYMLYDSETNTLGANLCAKSVQLQTQPIHLLLSSESERIVDPKAFESLFTVQTSSKFGGLKARSQLKDKCSNMAQGDTSTSSEFVFKLGPNTEKGTLQ